MFIEVKLSNFCLYKNSSGHVSHRIKKIIIVLTRTYRLGTLDDKYSVSVTEALSKHLSQYQIPFETKYFKDDLELVELIGQSAIPFYEMLHEALLENQIDLLIQPMEYVPLFLKDGLSISAVPLREHDPDVLSVQVDTDFLDDQNSNATVGVMSMRTYAQWKNRFPSHTTELSKKDTHARLQEVSVGDWDGAVFRAMELDRLTFDQYIDQVLDWMIPAPGQGAYAFITRDDDSELKAQLKPIEESVTRSCINIERDILKKLGVESRHPVGVAVAPCADIFEARIWISDEEGKQPISEVFKVDMDDVEKAGSQIAGELLKNGAGNVLKQFSGS